MIPKKRSKQRSKCSYSHYQQNFIYTHFQRNFNTKIISECQERLSSKKLREAVGRVMNEEVEEMEHNINNITCDTPFQSPGTKSVQKKIQVGH